MAFSNQNWHWNWFFFYIDNVYFGYAGIYFYDQLWFLHLYLNLSVFRFFSFFKHFYSELNELNKKLVWKIPWMEYDGFYWHVFDSKQNRFENIVKKILNYNNFLVSNIMPWEIKCSVAFWLNCKFFYTALFVDINFTDPYFCSNTISTEHCIYHMHCCFKCQYRNCGGTSVVQIWFDVLNKNYCSFKEN